MLCSSILKVAAIHVYTCIKRIKQRNEEALRELVTNLQFIFDFLIITSGNELLNI